MGQRKGERAMLFLRIVGRSVRGMKAVLLRVFGNAGLVTLAAIMVLNLKPIGSRAPGLQSVGGQGGLFELDRPAHGSPLGSGLSEDGSSALATCAAAMATPMSSSSQYDIQSMVVYSLHLRIVMFCCLDRPASCAGVRAEVVCVAASVGG